VYLNRMITTRENFEQGKIIMLNTQYEMCEMEDEFTIYLFF